MKFFILFLLTPIICTLSLTANAQGFLQASNGKIVNGNNQEVLLRGIGPGGWMLQEPYMLGLNGVAGNQTQIRNKIKALVGDANTTTFYNAWLNNHMRKRDVDSLKSWGFNSIRLPMHYNLFTLPIEQEPVSGQDTWLTKGFELTDSLLKWCKENQMYLILDLHAAPGGQGHDAAISDYDNTKPSLWQSTANQQKTINLWKKLAQRYANETWIGGYDLINETNWGFQNPSGDLNGCAESSNTPLRQLYMSITSAIREVDENHLIFIEGNCWSGNFSGLFPLWDMNLAISFHKYWNYNTTAAIQGMLNYRTTYNVPVWMGEAGENSNSWDRAAISLLERNNIGWAWWPIKKMGLNCPLEVKVDPGFQNIINYWKGNASQPSVSTAFNSLMAQAENLKTENCFYHKDFIDAMFRQVQTDAPLPFKEYLATDLIYATDYDLGPNNIAYYDLDTSNFNVSTGTYTTWNHGWQYRNDGVDIEACADTNTNGYNVGWTQNGEWLQYTIQVPSTGLYNLKIRTAGGSGQLIAKANGTDLSPSIIIPATASSQVWQTTMVNAVSLLAGKNIIRLHIQTGGFNLNYFQFAPVNPMPVRELSFSGEKIGLDNLLRWSTKEEINNHHFEIQHSNAGTEFASIGAIKTKAISGNSSSILNYSFTHMQAKKSINYYRLLQQDIDENRSYSSIIKIDNRKNERLTASLMENPVKDIVKLSVYAPVSQQVQVNLYSFQGSVIKSEKMSLQANLQNISIVMQQVPAGIYHLVINGASERISLNLIKD